MKKITLMMVVLLITTFAFAQKIAKKDIPNEIKIAFQKTFPNAESEKWEKEGNNFEVEFELGETEQSALFDAQGNLLETEMEIELNQLPKGVLEYVKTHYDGKKIKEAAKIIDAKGLIIFEVEIKNMDLIFDENGKFIKEISN